MKLCDWTEDENGTWDTACGHSFQSTEGGPNDNSVKFCCYCGEKLVAWPRQEPEDTSVAPARRR